MTYLLDINVLIALFDPVHVHHEAAHRWFGSVGHVSWASCPITENGFVRVISNPAYRSVLASPAEAAQRLVILRNQPGHVFWPDAVSLTEAARFDLSRLQGLQQITDLYLAALAVHYGGRLATFDGKIQVAAIVGAPEDCVHLISTA